MSIQTLWKGLLVIRKYRQQTDCVIYSSSLLIAVLVLIDLKILESFPKDEIKWFLTWSTNTFILKIQLAYVNLLVVLTKSGLIYKNSKKAQIENVYLCKHSCVVGAMVS